jgi:dTDP-glucose 4,6-dehydratase
MNLLVTGGAGFIGSHFVRGALADALPGLAGVRITVLDKLTYAGNFANLGPVAENRRLDFMPGDVGDAALVDVAMARHDAVVHFAADRTPAEVATTNVAGTQVLLDAALRHGVSRFVQVSTGAVYGSAPEASALAPSSPYAATKAGADLLALAYHRTHGLPVVVTRSAANYGPYQHPERLIPRFVTSLLAGGTVPLYGGGSHVREWVHVEDHCAGVALALMQGAPGAVYHVGGTKELTNRELTGMLLEACGAGWDRVAEVEDRGDDRRHALDDRRLREELGYRPRVEFEAGLAATVQWYRDNEDWWRPTVSD